MPGFHVLEVMRATGSFKLASRARAGSPWAVPLLVQPANGATGAQLTIIRDSHEIAKHAATGTSLYPSDPLVRDRVDEDLLLFHDRIGPLTRRFAYFHLFENLDAAAFAELATRNGAPAWQAAFLSHKAVYSRVRSYIGRGLGVSRKRAARAEQYILAELDTVAARLAGASASTFLHGGTPTLADLSFAAMLAPALGEPHPRVWMPPAEALGTEYSEKAAAFREHDAGRFAVDLLRNRDKIDAWGVPDFQSS